MKRLKDESISYCRWASGSLVISALNCVTSSRNIHIHFSYAREELTSQPEETRFLRIPVKLGSPARKKSSQTPANFFPGVLLTFCLHVLPLRSFPDINSEHHYLGSHGGHSVAKAKLVRSIHVGSKRVFSAGLSIAFINSFIIRPCNLDEENKRSYILFKIWWFQIHHYSTARVFWSDPVSSTFPSHNSKAVTHFSAQKETQW